MRKKLWLQFHLWTVALLALLTFANVASALRPFSADDGDVTDTLRLVENVSASLVRTPASEPEPSLDPRKTLKLAQIGCDPALRLRFEEGIRQVRLQFDSCPNLKSEDEIVDITNATNGFEATVFGGTLSKELAAAVQAEPDVPGAFIPSTPPKKVDAKAAKKNRNPASVSATVTTDYIALAAGVNEIKIKRTNREQTLKIERR